MAYVDIPKDLTRVKTKVMFNLTKRQLICFGSGALIGVPLFFLLKGSVATSAAALVMILVMLPFFMLGIFHIDGQEQFQFDWSWLAPSGLSTKDFIAPSGFAFREGRTFRMGKKYGAVSFLQILAPKLKDRILVDFLDLENSIVVNMHVQSIDQMAAIKDVKRKITDLDKMKIEAQKQAVRSGYDIDILPSDLATYGVEAKNILQDLQSRNERMFLFTFLLMHTADTKQQLDTVLLQAQGVAQQHNCQVIRLDYQQEEGLMSSLPLAYNQVEIQRSLTTSSTAVFVPFTTQELFQTGPEALYYGLNALSSNLIMVDRKLLKNPNRIISKSSGAFTALQDGSILFCRCDFISKIILY